MKNSLGINKILVIIIIVLAVFFISRLMGIGPFKAKSGDEVLGSMEEVAEKVTEMLDDGKEGKLTIYIGDMEEEELTGINFYLDTLKGNVTDIKTMPQSPGKTKVELNVNRSDSIYVLDSILDNKPIPEDKTNAIKLENKVREILDKNITDTMSAFDKELALHDYIVNNCRYGFFNDGSEWEYSAYGALVEGKAVCSGYAAAFDLLLKCAGLESRFVVGYAESSQRRIDDSSGEKSKRSTLKADNHAWNQVKIDGIWYNVDTIWDDPVGTKDMLSHMYFNIDDELMSMTHEWDEEDYEKCDSMGANYYSKTGTDFHSGAEMEAYANHFFTTGKKDFECKISGFEVNNDTLQFMFNINGVNSVGYSVSEMGDYKILFIDVK